MIIKFDAGELTRAITEYLADRYSKHRESMVVNYVCIAEGDGDTYVEAEVFYEKDSNGERRDQSDG